ncbi:MAG: lipopolysaccharide biosynthesis protein [Bacteroides sp.]|nr:lipopolysaccharide biosynthesis protein [Bacteroides sp.]
MSETLKQKTARGLFWGGLSNGLQQILSLIFGIVLARILDRSDYGMVGLLAIFVAIANTLQESGFTVALANKKEVTHKDYNAVFWCSTFIGAGMYVLLFFCAPLIADFYGKPELIPLSRFLFLGFLISSTGTAHNAILFRNLMVKQKAISQIIALTISGIVGITLALNGLAYWGLAIQSITYILVVTFCFWFFSPWQPTFSFDFSPLKKIIGFSSKVLLTNIFTQFNNNLFTTLLGKFYSVDDVGLYAQASKWNSMGYSLINGMTNGVAQPVLRQIANEPARQLNVFRKMLRFTAFISFPAMFGLALIAKELILITVTDRWLPSVPMLQMLCIWGAFFPINTLYSNLILSKSNSKIYMWNTITLGLLQLVVMLLVYPYGIYNMILFFVSINVGWFFIWHYFVRRQLHFSLKHALMDILPFAFIAGVCIVAAYFLTKEINNQYLLLLSKILITFVLYIFCMWVTKSVTFKESLAYLLRKKHDKK